MEASEGSKRDQLLPSTFFLALGLVLAAWIPDMITEATKNARAATDRFASDSGSKVGSIRHANQGVFSVSPADEVSEIAEPGMNASIMKTVRVVTTVEYYLDR